MVSDYDATAGECIFVLRYVFVRLLIVKAFGNSLQRSETQVEDLRGVEVKALGVSKAQQDGKSS